MEKRHMPWSVSQMFKMINVTKSIVFDSPFQRPEGQWKKENQSLLIDSLLRMFIPPVYGITYEENGKKVYSIIDGKQRLTTISSFINDEWALTELDDIKIEGETYQLSGKKFSELDEAVQDVIKSEPLAFQLIALEDGDDEETIVDMIFTRLNNGIPVSSAHKAYASILTEIRNYVSKIVKENKMIAEATYFTGAEKKNSQREMTVMQNLILTQDIYFSDFTNKTLGSLLTANPITEETFTKVETAYDMLAETFKDMQQDKFLRKINIVAFADLLIKEDFNKNVLEFLLSYKDTMKKGDVFKHYTGSNTTKRSSVIGRLQGIKTLYENWKKENNLATDSKEDKKQTA